VLGYLVVGDDELSINQISVGITALHTSLLKWRLREIIVDMVQVQVVAEALVRPEFFQRERLHDVSFHEDSGSMLKTCVVENSTSISAFMTGQPLLESVFLGRQLLGCNAPRLDRINVSRRYY
jgi:hypothetical protein